MSDGVFEVKVPRLLEGEATITVMQWLYDEGDSVEEGDDLVEMNSVKENFTLKVPVSGVLSNIFYYDGEKPEVDEVIAEIEEEEE